MISCYSLARRLRETIQQAISYVKSKLGPRAKALGHSLWLIVAAVILVALIHSWRHIDFGTYRLRPAYLFLSAIPHALAFSLGGMGWALIVRSIDESQGMRDSFRIYFLSSIGRNIPGGFWHIAGRIHLHNQAGGSGATTVVATAVELVLAVLAGTGIYAVGVLTSSVDPLIPRGLLILLLVLEAIALWPPLFNRFINWFVERFSKQEVPPIAVRGSTIIRWVILYLAILFLGGVVLCFVGNAVYPLAWQELPSLAGAWGISMAMSGLTFWLPVRLGIRDGALVIALAQRMPISAAFVISVLWRVWISVLEVIWAALAASVAWWESR